MEWPRYVRTTDILTPRSLRNDDFVSQPPEIASRASLIYGDIVACAAGTVGKNFIYLSSHPACYAGFLVRFRAAENVDHRYVSYWMQSKHYWAQIDCGAVRSTIDNFSASKYRSLLVPDLPQTDQRRIADFLDDRVARIDKIIAARQQQRLRNEEILCSLENKLTTIGSGDTRSTCIEWMPEISSEYELWRVSRAFSTASGTTPRSDSSMYYGSGTPWITTSDLRDKIISLIPHSVTDESFRDYSALKKFPSGTLIVAMYGATAGRLGILESPAATNQACCAMLPSGPVDVWYAFHWFHAHRSHIMALASGGGQPNINQDLVRSLFISAPNIKKQKEIVDILSEYQEDLREADDALIRQIDLLQEYKQSLITAAVTGEFDVTTASTRIPE